MYCIFITHDFKALFIQLLNFYDANSLLFSGPSLGFNVWIYFGIWEVWKEIWMKNDTYYQMLWLTVCSARPGEFTQFLLILNSIKRWVIFLVCQMISYFSFLFSIMVCNIYVMTNFIPHIQLIKDYKLFMVVGVLVFIDVATLTTWQIVDPFYRATSNGTGEVNIGIQ